MSLIVEPATPGTDCEVCAADAAVGVYDPRSSFCGLLCADCWQQYRREVV